MPTPMSVYADIASRYGVNALDEEAIDTFFTETVATLPTQEQENIIEELLKRDTEASQLPVPTDFDNTIQSHLDLIKTYCSSLDHELLENLIEIFTQKSTSNPNDIAIILQALQEKRSSFFDRLKQEI